MSKQARKRVVVASAPATSETRSIATVEAEIRDVRAALARTRREFLDAARSITANGIFVEQTVGGNHRRVRVKRVFNPALKIQREMSSAIRAQTKVLEALELDLAALKKVAQESESIETKLDAFLERGN